MKIPGEGECGGEPGLRPDEGRKSVKLKGRQGA